MQDIWCAVLFSHESESVYIAPPLNSEVVFLVLGDEFFLLLLLVRRLTWLAKRFPSFVSKYNFSLGNLL